MAELIRIAEDGSLGFGDYTLFEKTKLSDFEFMGDIYKVKTYRELTKFEKNDVLVYESEPGTNVDGLKVSDKSIRFTVEGDGATQMTLALDDGAEYKVTVGGQELGVLATTMGGKLVLSVELESGNSQEIVLVRK